MSVHTVEVPNGSRRGRLTVAGGGDPQAWHREYLALHAQVPWPRRELTWMPIVEPGYLKQPEGSSEAQSEQLDSDSYALEDEVSPGRSRRE
jgi:hypothetical protein